MYVWNEYHNSLLPNMKIQYGHSIKFAMEYCCCVPQNRKVYHLSHIAK